MEKISPRLSSMIATEDARRPVEIHVMFKSDVGAALPGLVESLTTLAVDPQTLDVFGHGGLVHLVTALGAVERIAAMPEVVWIDLESTAPVRTLIDPEPNPDPTRR